MKPSSISSMSLVLCPATPSPSLASLQSDRGHIAVGASDSIHDDDKVDLQQAAESALACNVASGEQRSNSAALGSDTESMTAEHTSGRSDLVLQLEDAIKVREYDCALDATIFHLSWHCRLTRRNPVPPLASFIQERDNALREAVQANKLLRKAKDEHKVASEAAAKDKVNV